MFYFMTNGARGLFGGAGYKKKYCMSPYLLPSQPLRSPCLLTDMEHTNLSQLLYLLLTINIACRLQMNHTVILLLAVHRFPSKMTYLSIPSSTFFLKKLFLVEGEEGTVSCCWLLLVPLSDLDSSSPPPPGPLLLELCVATPGVCVMTTLSLLEFITHVETAASKGNKVTSTRICLENFV